MRDMHTLSKHGKVFSWRLVFRAGINMTWKLKFNKFGQNLFTQEVHVAYLLGLYFSFM